MKFEESGLNDKIIKAVTEIGFDEMTDIQAKSIPVILGGKDVLGESMTGSGKTAAFSLPIIENVKPGEGIQALIVAPVRELAMQISEQIEKFSKYMNLSTAVVYGGVSIMPQVEKIQRSEIVVGTPGRIVDHLTRKTLVLDNVKFLVLDETDRMLDMGFIDDIKKIFSRAPENRQTLLFSATIPPEIKRLTDKYMKHPVRISAQKHVSRDLLKHYYYDVNRGDKIGLLAHLIKKERPSLAIVFTSTRKMSDILSKSLQSLGLQAKAIHGGLTQSRRTNIMEGFHKGRPRILIATDVAARGLDIKDVTHVFNFDVPKTVDDYTHRTGRTARSGKEGKAITLLCREDHDSFRRIVHSRHIEKIEDKDFSPRNYDLGQRERKHQRSHEKRYGQDTKKHKKYKRIHREYMGRRR